MKYAFFICILAVVHGARIDPKANPEDYRLPEDAVEVDNYDIELRLRTDTFDNKIFDGIASVTFRNLKDTNEVKFHANKIQFTEDVVLEDESGNPITLTNTDFVSNPETDIVTLKTNTPLQVNSTYILKFVYTAELRTDEMYGFYRSVYINEDGDEIFLGTTQFQPTHARKAFPCFDEPKYKAVFNLKIRHLATYNAIGNTRGSNETDQSDSNFIITTFAPTPRMSTYLVAFVVSDFTCENSVVSDGEPEHLVCSRNETAPLRKTALEVGPALIRVMEEWTNIKYLDSGIGKMHQVAIPDFSAGAMENWGLLTYRETGLLWDEEESSNSYLQGLKNVVSHEVAHMWFGNLVTCHWWSDTFLNEGFARYFQYFGTAEVESSWQLDKQFVTAQVQPMLVTDAQPSARALSHNASTQTEISGRFSSVSYNKGASILRMLQHFMGPNNFKEGVRQYLLENKYGTTKPADLWNALQGKVSAGSLPDGTDIAVVIENWIVKPGFPLLEVTLENDTISISQKRFVISGTPNEDDSWYVPISYTLSSDDAKFEGTSARAWLIPNNNLRLNDALNSDDWIILNNQQIGYYRIKYDDTLLSRIENALASANFGGIHELNRAQLVDDLYNLANIGTYTYARFFNFVSFLKKDTSYYSWNSAITAFNNMLQRTSNEKIRTSLSSYILDLVKTLYESKPFNEPKDNDQIYTFNRVQAITLACRLNYNECLEAAKEAYSAYKTTGKADKNLKGVIYCNGLRHSTDITRDWGHLWEQYNNTKLATERVTIISALGCTTDQTVLNTYLQMSINSSSGIRQQDALSVFSAVYSQNPKGVDYAFEFLLENYREISTYYGSMNSLSNLFSGLAGRFTRQDQIDKLQNFIDTAEDLTEGVITSASNAILSAKANLEWTEEFEKQLTEYFDLGTGTADCVRIGFTTTIMSILLLFYHLLN